MEYINAPWRAQYVKNVYKTKGCIFCQALKQEDDREAFILYRGRNNFIMRPSSCTADGTISSF